MANTKITSRVIAADAVLTANITDANVTTAKIADDAVTSAKLDTNIAIDGTLDVASDVTLTSATSTKPHLIIKNTNADDGAPQLQFIKDSSSPADNDEIGRIYMYGDDDAGNPYEGVLIRGIATDVSNGSEDTTLEFFTQKAGSQASTLALASGRLGVGTSSPDSDAILHAKGTTAHTYMTVEANAGVTAASKYISGSNAWRVGIDTTCGADGDLVFANTESGTPIYGKFESDGDFQIHTSDSGIGRMGHIKTKYVTLADDGLISLGSGTTCGAWQVHVYERGSGAGAIFHCDYDGTTILVNQFVAGGAGFANSNADGYYGLYKGDNSHTVYFQNRNGASRTFHIMVYGAEV